MCICVWVGGGGEKKRGMCYHGNHKLYAGLQCKDMEILRHKCIVAQILRRRRAWERG